MSGKKIILATSKPEIYAEKIAKKFGFYELFDNISGALLDGSRIEKDDIIRYALERVGESDISKCIMIGDRSYDVLGAKAFNMDSIGVTWGYGDRAELHAAGATYIVNKAEEIKEII